MQYITGIHALNLPCNLNTTGDWHTSGIQWEKPHTQDSSDSIFGEWGIEAGHKIPDHQGTYFVANHIRACLDMLAAGDFSDLKGMRDDYICHDEYTPLIFGKVLSLRDSSMWDAINRFMEREYRMQWIHFFRRAQNEAGSLATGS